MRKYFMSIPAIIIVSITLSCLLSMSWLEWIDFRNHKVAFYTMLAIFAAYAGAVTYFRGKKIWHKIVIFAIVLIVQTIMFFLIFSIWFAIGMAGFD